MTDLNIPLSSKDLYDAYVAWRDCEEGDEYWLDKTQFGLCHWRRTDVHAELFYHQLDCAHLDHSYPFGGREAYWAAFRAENQHLNPTRIKWVNDRIADYELYHSEENSL